MHPGHVMDQQGMSSPISWCVWGTSARVGHGLVGRRVIAGFRKGDAVSNWEQTEDST